MVNNFDENNEDFLAGLDGDFDDEDLFGDEKLDAVLDEIEEIRRTIQYQPTSSYDDYSYRDDGELTRTTQMLNQEIRRLNQRITDMQDKVGTDDYGESMQRLIELTQQLIRMNAESDKKMSVELDTLKKQLHGVSSLGDLGATLSAIQGNVAANEQFIESINSTIAQDGADSSPKIVPEILRQLYDIKSLIGAASPVGTRRNDEMLALYNMLAKVKYDVSQKTLGIAEKYASVDALVKRIYDTNEYDIAPIVDGVNELISRISVLPLSKTDADAVLEYVQTNGGLTLATAKRDSIVEYLASVDSYVRDGANANLDQLPDIIALKNDIQGGRNEIECEKVYNAVLNANIALISERDMLKQRELRAELKELVAKLVLLEAQDLVVYSQITVTKPYRAPFDYEGNGLFSKLGELKNYLLEANLSGTGGEISQPAANSLVSEINNLRNEIYNLGNMSDVSQSLLDLKTDCVAILEKLDGKSGDAVDYSAAPTLGEIVSQLDRLFDDIKNIATDSENSILSAVEVIGEAIAALSNEQESAKSDREKLIEDISYIRSAVSGEPIEASASLSSELGDRLTALEKKQDDIIKALTLLTENSSSSIDEKINGITARLDALESERKTTADSILTEIKGLRDQLYSVTVANVSDAEGGDTVDSYNNIILNEVYSIGDELTALSKKVEAIEKSVDVDAITGQINSLKEEMMKRPQRGAKQKSAPPKPRPTTVVPVTRKKPASVTVIESDAGIGDLLDGIAMTDSVIDFSAKDESEEN